MARRWTLTRGGCQSAQGPGVGRSQSGANLQETDGGIERIDVSIRAVDRNIDGRNWCTRYRRRSTAVVVIIVRNTLHEHATGQRFKQGERERERERKLSPTVSCRQHHRRGSSAPLLLPAVPHCSKLRNEPFEKTRRSCLPMVREYRLPCLVVRAPGRHSSVLPVISCLDILPVVSCS
jgi:hypothetical protein